MKLANNIKVTVFIKTTDKSVESVSQDLQKPEEDENSLKDKFLELFPFNLEDEKILLKRSKATGFNQKEIIIYEVELNKDKHTNSFLKNLKEKLDEQQKIMLVRQEDRLDECLNFFIRLDKESLLNGQYQVTDCGQCIHIRISIAAFPRKREVALEVVKKIFS
jgi:RNA binding exosome subunit